MLKGLPPEIDSIDPDEEEVVAQVNIIGTRFGEAQGESSVTFNGADAGEAGYWSNTLLIVTVPEGATSSGRQPGRDVAVHYDPKTSQTYQVFMRIYLILGPHALRITQPLESTTATFQMPTFD